MQAASSIMVEISTGGGLFVGYGCSVRQIVSSKIVRVISPFNGGLVKMEIETRTERTGAERGAEEMK